jgi:hydroxymethylpyrimidine/phosphomethylpyrimidine kinase
LLQKPRMQTVLSIAGFDPSSGAGVTADLMVFAAHGLFGTSCITSLTVQSTLGVRSTHPVDPEILRATLETLSEDLPPAGIKIGMLSNAAAVTEVIDFLANLHDQGLDIPVVLDPVLRSSSGGELLEPSGIDLLRNQLLPLVGWVTPNLDELAVLTGLSVDSHADISNAASALQSLAGTEKCHVLVTGGHRTPPDDLLLSAGGGSVWIPGQYVASTSTHGTGCALSSALLSRLVLGDQPHAAALAAKQYVAEAIHLAVPLGGGNGPLNHLWPLKVR